MVQLRIWKQSHYAYTCRFIFNPTIFLRNEWSRDWQNPSVLVSWPKLTKNGINVQTMWPIRNYVKVKWTFLWLMIIRIRIIDFWWEFHFIESWLFKQQSWSCDQVIWPTHTFFNVEIGKGFRGPYTFQLEYKLKEVPYRSWITKKIEFLVF